MNNVPSKELLEIYIKESNLIENIHVRKNQHLFIDHLLAANYTINESVAGKLAIPEWIHKLLMKRVKQKLLIPGELRTVFVRVGPHLKPSPKIIPILFERWKESLKKDLKTANSLTIDKRKDLVGHYHYWFESIHPFVDGNGRTGRLVLNNTRLLLNLPWLIIYSAKRFEYYENIRKWEKEHQDLLFY